MTGFDERSIGIRWLDYDVIGHISSTIYPVYFSEARGDFVMSRMGRWVTLPVVDQQIGYKQEIVFPARTVVVRTRVLRFGRKSLTFEQEALREDGALAATCICISAAWDPQTRTSRPLTDEEREKLGPEASPAPA